MKIQTERVVAIQTINNQGKEIIVNGVKKAIIHTATNKQIWAPAQAVNEATNMVTFKVNEKGDKFTATRDSSRVGEDGNLLYLKGDIVTRTQESLEFIGATTEKVFTTADKEKMEFAAKLGLAVHI